MIRQPPTSTPSDTRFPDTTLSRSQADGAGGAAAGRAGRGRPIGRSGHRLLRAAGAVDRTGQDADPVRRGRRRFGPDAGRATRRRQRAAARSEEHTSELQSLMRISYAVFCLKKKNKKNNKNTHYPIHKTRIIIEQT